MLPVTFNEQNFVFKKPEGWNDEQCFDLPVFRGPSIMEDGSTIPVIISKWQPSKEDIEAINRGEAIYLTITGTAMPPVSLFTEYPFVFPNTEECNTQK